MRPGPILQLILILTGVVMLCITIASLAKRKMNESFCLVWGVVSVVIVLAGILLRPVGWNNYLSGIGLALILIIFFCILYAVYFICERISELTRKNQELAIQVSLLNQENERILKRLSEVLDEDVRNI